MSFRDVVLFFYRVFLSFSSWEGGKEVEIWRNRYWGKDIGGWVGKKAERKTEDCVLRVEKVGMKVRKKLLLATLTVKME